MRRTILYGGGGLGFGVAFAVLELVVMGAVDSTIHDHRVPSYRLFNRAFEVLNAPALGISDFWTDVWRMPPRGEIAWVVVPAVSVLLQWGVIGLVAGLVWKFAFAPSPAFTGNIRSSFEMSLREHGGRAESPPDGSSPGDGVD